jgi:hypothetical protein
MAPKKTEALSWPELQVKLMAPSMTEDKLLKMLEAEKAGLKRPQYVLRIHGRYNVVRAKNERKDLLK